MKAWYRFPFEEDSYFLEENKKAVSEEYFIMEYFNKQKRIHIPADDLKQVKTQAILEVDFDLVKSPRIPDEDYINLVKEAKTQMKEGQFEKVVLARATKHSYKKNPIQIYKDLCKTYSNCFVHLVYIDEGYFSIGATPERLLHWDKSKVLSASMAGTINADEGTFSAKELEEQHIVTQYILDIFKKNELLTESESFTLNNGQLEHLYTQIKSQTRIDRHAATKLLGELAPTPAVGGSPKESSLEWLRTHERMKRNWYSGIIGFVGKDKIRTYVNLRCGTLYSDCAVLYAGAGITQGSNPAKEFSETEAKMKNLGDLIS